MHSKFIVLDRGSERPGLVFINANTHQTHQGFLDATGIESSGGSNCSIRGFSVGYDAQKWWRPTAASGHGSYWTSQRKAGLTRSAEMERIYAFTLAANVPALSDNLLTVYIGRTG